ncbi:uncharacterized protein LOC144445967 [Glandiceps talaboti]
MARHDSDHDKDRKRHKQKKHDRRSRSKSRSRERDYDSHKSKHRKSRRRSRSRSPVEDYRSKRRSRRSRSRSRGRRRSRSRSRTRRRSRSRSTNRSKRSSRRSRSRSPKVSKDLFGRDKRRSRDRSYSRSPSVPKVLLKADLFKEEKKDPFADVPGFEDMTPAEKTKVKMQKALEAAASADAALRQKGLLQDKLSVAEALQRQQTLEEIEEDGFVPSTFKSGKESKLNVGGMTGLDKSHDAAIFGGNPDNITVEPFKVAKPGTIVYKDRGPLASHSLFASPEEKEQRWIQKLEAMRREKIIMYRASTVKQEQWS